MTWSAAMPSAGSVRPRSYVLGVTDGMEDSLHRSLGGFVLPDADHGPAGRAQRTVGPSVSLDVAAELGGPVPLVARRLAPMSGADVPETAVDEYGYLPPSKDDVRPYAASVEVQPMVFSEAVAQCVKGGAKPNFRLRVDASVGPHVSGPTRVERLRSARGRGGRRVIFHEASVRAVHV